MKANWFTGTLYVELGWGFHHEDKLETTHNNFQVLEVKEGKVISSKYWEDHWKEFR